MSTLTIIIPLYQSESHIPQLLTAICTWVNTSKMENFPKSIELILLDDGSGDNGLIIAEQFLSQQSISYTLLSLASNCGQHTALAAGIHYSQSDWIITMDDDLQHNPEDIQRLWNCATETQSLLVYGFHSKSKHSTWRNIASVLTRGISKLLFHDYSRVTSFRLFHRSVASYFNACLRSSFLIDTHLMPAAKKVGYVEVPHQIKINASSRYSVRRLITMTLKIWVWHSFLIRFRSVKRAILPPQTISLQWFGGSNPLQLLRLQHRHIQMLREWRNSEFVSSQMDYREPISAEQQEQWFAQLNPQTHHYFMHRYRGEWVGMTHVNLYENDDPGITSQVWGENGGFLQSKRWQGTGIAICMAIYTLDYAFNQCQVGFLRIKVHRENQEAIQLNTALGYRKVAALDADFDRYELQAHEYLPRADKLKRLIRHLG